MKNLLKFTINWSLKDLVPRHHRSKSDDYINLFILIFNLDQLLKFFLLSLHICLKFLCLFC